MHQNSIVVLSFSAPLTSPCFAIKSLSGLFSKTAATTAFAPLPAAETRAGL
ncbi:MAG: hypothetical protein WCB31_02475 [Nitrososphaeraceae archaeon]